MKLRHPGTSVVIDVPDEANLASFPGFEPIGNVSDVPPMGGRGSGRDAWASYAARHGVDVADDDTREDIIAALDEAGVPTETKE